jgi:hypothetical protein
MDKLSDLILREEWKQGTQVFVTHKKPCAVMAPMVSKETYDADRERWRTITRICTSESRLDARLPRNYHDVIQRLKRTLSACFVCTFSFLPPQSGQP